ncbi:autotransporter assembly complex protein TamA [Pseudoalteromonas sp. T1lg75]|uniref:autotransporter assembly complex protein TamA n=1 Tax=Pseudoalteromonas sp. T1lg75 TaxID=2077102 RepID=UPI0018FED6E6|nr:autotransporter assembly complex family protein [Pseudoalteromonas sp. T1lg75]
MKLTLLTSLLLVLSLCSFDSYGAWGSEPGKFPQGRIISGYSIEGIEGELEKNVALYLQQLSGEQPTRQLQRYATDQVLLSMRALGYYHAEVDLRLEDNSAEPKVIAKITAGQATRIESLEYRLLGPGEQDKELTQVLAQLPLKRGDIINHGHYDAAKSTIDKQLLELGYFDAKWQEARLAIDRGHYSAEISLVMSTGQRYRFGPLNIATDTPASAYIHSLAEFEPGQAYNATKVSNFNLALSQTPYFSSVRVYADIAKRSAQEVPIRVEVLHKPQDSFEVGGGYSTDLGPKVRFKWSRPWIGAQGHYLESNLNVSERQQDISLSYTIPVADPVDDIWRFSLGYKLEDNIDTDIFSKTLTGLVQRQWKIEEDWIRTVFLRREYEEFRIGEEEKSTAMLLPGVSYARKRSKGGTTPYWGRQWLISTEVGADSLASSTDIIRVQLQYAWLNTYWQRHLFFSRVNIGAMYVDDIGDVPVSLRFFAGGDQSIRGFKYESISPEVDGAKVGGKYLVTGTLEYNYQFASNWRSALFVDAGTATNDFSEKLSVGVGFGVRYLTPVGPIRIDHAWALSTPGNTTRLSITVGPEL